MYQCFKTEPVDWQSKTIDLVWLWLWLVWPIYQLAWSVEFYYVNKQLVSPASLCCICHSPFVGIWGRHCRCQIYQADSSVQGHIIRTNKISSMIHASALNCFGVSMHLPKDWGKCSCNWSWRCRWGLCAHDVLLWCSISEKESDKYLYIIVDCRICCRPSILLLNDG